MQRFIVLAFLLGLSTQGLDAAEVFRLPTANRAIFDKDGEERFFVATPGRTWLSGTFGCVRSDGWQLHEGLDIRALRFDKQGEPIDPVMAAADGTVAYINSKPSLSNYGNYIILKHRVEGIEIFTTYAHLRSIRDGLKSGTAVKAGETIATLGRTANTKQGISKDRAHVHFEINLFYNDNFIDWYKKTYPDQKNDHGTWNGRNLTGIDPRKVFIEQQRLGDSFSLLTFIRNQTEMFRVQVRDTNFPWLKRYAPLVRRNPKAEKDGIAGYEIAFNFNGLPFQLIPLGRDDLKNKGPITLLSVNSKEQSDCPCGKLVHQRSGRWELTNHAIELIGLLTR
ncbi:MAG TPA: M23 family metallopeptidase [Roseimicrobium sp.]|nr:M23 family metallopeptidase [Roseimicrobium sp.]